MAGLDGGRLNIAACSLGGAQGGARQGARLHGRAQGVRQTARRLPGAAVQARRHGDRARGAPAASCGARPPRSTPRRPNATRLCAMAKRFATDAGFKVANDALQLLGGYGYLADYGIEKIVRDLRVHQILEGTNEIMRLIVARGAPRRRSRSGGVTGDGAKASLRPLTEKPNVPHFLHGSQGCAGAGHLARVSDLGGGARSKPCRYLGRGFLLPRPNLPREG